MDQFIAQSTLRAIEQLAEQQGFARPIRLTMDESRRFCAMSDEPPKPNEALRRAMAHREWLRNISNRRP